MKLIIAGGSLEVSHLTLFGLWWRSGFWSEFRFWISNPGSFKLDAHCATTKLLNALVSGPAKYNNKVHQLDTTERYISEIYHPNTLARYTRQKQQPDIRQLMRLTRRHSANAHLRSSVLEERLDLHLKMLESRSGKVCPGKHPKPNRRIAKNREEWNWTNRIAAF